MVSNVEAKGHRWVDLCVVDFFSWLLMEADMIFLDWVQIKRHSRQSIMRVQKYQVILLHPNEVVGFFRAASNYATVQLLHEEGLNRAEILSANFFKAKPGWNKDKNSIPPVSLKIYFWLLGWWFSTLFALFLFPFVFANSDVLIAKETARVLCISILVFLVALFNYLRSLRWCLLFVFGLHLLLLSKSLTCIPVIIFLLVEEWLLHIWLIVHPARQNILLEEQTGLLDMNGLFLWSGVLFHELN